MPIRAAVLLAITGLLAVGVTAAGGRPGSHSGIVAGADPAGDVTATGLTAAERAAIDIVSVRAAGKEGIGVLVTVAFKGNFGALMGRGNLKNAAVVLVLRGKTEGSSAGVVTLGPGPLGVVARHTRSTQAGAVRSARQVTFFVAGPGYGSVASVTVEVLVKPPPLGVRVPAGRSQPPVHIPDAYWAVLLAAAPDDKATVSDPNPMEFKKRDIGIPVEMIKKAIVELERYERQKGPTERLLDTIYALDGLGTVLRLYRVTPDLGPGPPVDARLVSEPPGFLFTMTNRGAEPLDALLIGLRGGVHHTGARLVTPGGSCGPGSGPSEVRCTFAAPLPPGAKAEAVVATDTAYDVAQGVDILVRKAGDSAFSGPFRVGVPAAPTACECADIGVKATGAAHGHVTNPQGPVSLSLFLDWTMSCAGSTGACEGQITVVPSGDLKLSTPKNGTVACKGTAGCPDTSKGRFVARMTSAGDLHNTGPAGRNVPITLKIYCKSGKALVLVRTALLDLHFDADGFLKPKLSDLAG